MGIFFRSAVFLICIFVFFCAKFLSTKRMSEEESRRTVLICLDRSENANRAFQFYLKTVRHEGDKVILLHVFELPPLPYSSGPFVVAYYEEWKAMCKETEDNCRMMLKHFEETCLKEGIPEPHSFLAVGKPAGETICDVAKDEKVNLIVIGTRGQSLIWRKILGSVSEYVVHHAHVPVAVIPAPLESDHKHTA